MKPNQAAPEQSDAPAGVLQGSGRWLAAIGNHDFCPWANRYVYWLKQPIGWLVVGVFMATLTAVFLDPEAWIIVGSLLAVMLVGTAWPWIAMKGLDAEIQFDRRRGREGDVVQVRLTIANRWPWPLWGLAVENGFFVQEDDEGEKPVAALARVSGWSRSDFTFDFRPEKRGVYPHAAPELTTGFPFGIWRSSKTVVSQQPLLVWPRTTALTSIPSLGGDIADVIGMLFDRPGDEGDFIGVRPFRQGDRLRSVHWAQTARRDALIVTERQAAARRLVVVAIDTAAFSQPETGDLDIAIRVAASIAKEFHGHHAEVRFIVGAMDLRLSQDSAGLRRLLDDLARFRPDRQPSECPIAFDPQALTVVVTSDRSDWGSSSGGRSQLRIVRIAPSVVVDSTHRSHSAWIHLDGRSDLSPQLQHQWERACHDSLAK